jgi:hypothetical protein
MRARALAFELWPSRGQLQISQGVRFYAKLLEYRLRPGEENRPLVPARDRFLTVRDLHGDLGKLSTQGLELEDCMYVVRGDMRCH